MSYNSNNQGKAFEPGWFLANNEQCTRETKQISAEGVEADEYAQKIVKGGTAYPSNDANAIGIVYEDVNVTSGDMPGSVVTKGEVYEDRLAVTGAEYDSVTLKDLVSPAAQGWYESDGEATPTYTLSTDTTVDTTKTYYSKSGDNYTEVSDYASVLNPKALGWYERTGSSPNYVYTLSTDTEGDKTKTYYEKSDVRLASTAKTALEALGFKFKTVPTVTR